MITGQCLVYCIIIQYRVVSKVAVVGVAGDCQVSLAESYNVQPSTEWHDTPSSTDNNLSPTAAQ